MTSVRRRMTALVAIVAAAATPVIVTSPVAQADEYPVLTTDGTICYERAAEEKSGPVITVELSEPSKEDVSFVLSTEDGTAVAPDDYLTIEAVEFRIPAGERSIQIQLSIIADKEREDDEWFLVKLESAVGAIIGTEKAEVIIKDGAPPPDGPKR